MHLIKPYLVRPHDLKHLFLCPPSYFLLLLDQTQSLRALVQPGFVSYRAENTFSNSSETGENVVYRWHGKPGWIVVIQTSAVERYRKGLLAEFVILVQASLVRSLEIEESVDTSHWFPAPLVLLSSD